MSPRLLAFALALGVASCGAADDGLDRRAPDPLDADWLQGSATITPALLARELELGAGNPEASALAREALARLGGGQMAALAACFSPCPASVTAEGGLTSVKSSDAWVSRSLEEIAFGERPERDRRQIAELLTGRFRDTRVVEHADFVLVERTFVPEICVVARQSVAAAYESIVHELVHALRLDPRAPAGLIDASPDEHGFLSAFVLVPGGEVDAYTTGTRARLRLAHRTYRVSPLLALFDQGSGEPRASAPTMAEIILASKPQGLGYADGLFRGKFAETRAAALEERDKRRDLLERVLGERRQNLAIATSNIEVHTHNLAAHQYNLGIAGENRDQALAERSRRGLADAERGLARARAMMAAARASEARLTEELATIARRGVVSSRP